MPSYTLEWGPRGVNAGPVFGGSWGANSSRIAKQSRWPVAQTCPGGTATTATPRRENLLQPPSSRHGYEMVVHGLRARPIEWPRRGGLWSPLQPSTAARTTQQHSNLNRILSHLRGRPGRQVTPVAPSGANESARGQLLRGVDEDSNQGRRKRRAGARAWAVCRV